MSIFKPITVIDGWDTCCEIALRRMSLDLADDKSTLVQVMAWCRQATSHYWANVDPVFCCYMASLGPNEWTLMCWIVFSKYENIFAFCIISPHWDGTGSWNPSSWKTKTSLSCIGIMMLADDLVILGASALAAIVLTHLPLVPHLCVSDSGLHWFR